VRIIYNRATFELTMNCFEAQKKLESNVELTDLEKVSLMLKVKYMALKEIEKIEWTSVVSTHKLNDELVSQPKELNNLTLYNYQLEALTW